MFRKTAGISIHTMTWVSGTQLKVMLIITCDCFGQPYNSQKCVENIASAIVSFPRQCYYSLNDISNYKWQKLMDRKKASYTFILMVSPGAWLFAKERCKACWEKCFGVSDPPLVQGESLVKYITIHLLPGQSIGLLWKYPLVPLHFCEHVWVDTNLCDSNAFVGPRIIPTNPCKTKISWLPTLSFHIDWLLIFHVSTDKYFCHSLPLSQPSWDTVLYQHLQIIGHGGVSCECHFYVVALHIHRWHTLVVMEPAPGLAF